MTPDEPAFTAYQNFEWLLLQPKSTFTEKSIPKRIQEDKTLTLEELRNTTRDQHQSAIDATDQCIKAAGQEVRKVELQMWNARSQGPGVGAQNEEQLKEKLSVLVEQMWVFLEKREASP